MTAATLTHLPLAAGGAVLAGAGRAALWAFSRYMRSPLTNTAILSMVTLTAMAGSNALYLQEHKHPSPLFASPAMQQPAKVARIAPVVPAARPNRAVLPRVEEATGSIGLPTEPIGNSDVFEMQRKLQLLDLFDGTIDGYYGPQTARAIKKFEELNGLPLRGELTKEILALIRNAPAVAVVPAPRQLPAPEPLAATDPLPRVEMRPVSEAPASPETLPAVMPKTMTLVQKLPPPKPLVVGSAPKALPAAQAVSAPARTQMGRELPETPQQAFNLAVDTAGDAIDTIIAGVQSVAAPSKPAAAPVAALDARRPVLATPAAATEQQMSPVRQATTLALAQPVAVPGQPLVVAEPEPQAVAEVPVLDTEATPEDLMPPFSVTDPVIVARVQRGLGSLGFLHGPADGVAGEATAKAIRNFEVYYNYKVTGRISPELLDLLVANGASI